MCELLLERLVKAAAHLATVFSDEKVFADQLRFISRAWKHFLFLQRRRAIFCLRVESHSAVSCAPAFVTRLPLLTLVKLNTLSLLRVYPDLNHYRPRRWVWLKGGVLGHKAMRIQESCSAHLSNFFVADEWPPNSPDPNVVAWHCSDYFVRSGGHVGKCTTPDNE